MSYKGRFKPRNYQKYKGDPTQIVYRSLWERKFMQYCDTTQSVLEWGSEEFWIPYRSPVDQRVHRYFPDFHMKLKEKNGVVKRYVIEVKPLRQTQPPIKKKTKTFLYESMEYAKNQAKWKAARAYCQERRYEFKIITEKELGI